jgi:MFS family permease
MHLVPHPPRGPFRDMPREVAILTSVSFTVALGFGIVAPDIRSAVWTGIGFGVVGVLNAATLLPGGRAADALGRRPVIVTGCLLSAGGMAMLALLPGLLGVPGRTGRTGPRFWAARRRTCGNDR